MLMIAYYEWVVICVIQSMNDAIATATAIAVHVSSMNWPLASSMNVRQEISIIRANENPLETKCSFSHYAFRASHLLTMLSSATIIASKTNRLCFALSESLHSREATWWAKEGSQGLCSSTIMVSIASTDVTIIRRARAWWCFRSSYDRISQRVHAASNSYSLIPISSSHSEQTRAAQ